MHGPRYELRNALGEKKGVTDKDLSSRRLEYPALTLSMKVMRKPFFYTVTVAAPMAVFVFLGSRPVALLGVKDLSARLGILSSVLLAAITHSSIVRQYLPKVPYLTTLDKHSLICQAVLVAWTVESCLVYGWTRGLAENSLQVQGVHEEDTCQTQAGGNK